MADVPLPGQDSIDAQAEMFRLAEKEQGLSVAVLARRSPIPLSTLKGWKTGSAMPAWALGALRVAGVAEHLLSLVLEPFGLLVADRESEDGALAELGREGAHYVAEHADAVADGVVTSIERGRLKDRARRIAAIARNVAEG